VQTALPVGALTFLPVPAGLVEPPAVLLGGPAMRAPVLLHRVGRESQLSDSAHARAVEKGPGDGLLQLVLGVADADECGADPVGVWDQ
jgi:hypothetical protein